MLILIFIKFKDIDFIKFKIFIIKSSLLIRYFINLNIFENYKFDR